MHEEHEGNELFRVSQLIILIGYTAFSTLLTLEAFLLSWEKWAIILVILGTVIGWLLQVFLHL